MNFNVGAFKKKIESDIYYSERAYFVLSAVARNQIFLKSIGDAPSELLVLKNNVIYQYNGSSG
jgi:hypothetical protein